ncbi:MAG: S41 family peptidase [Acidobacteriota bacterium]
MSRLTSGERQQIVDQALVLIEQLYVHLPLKRAMHAVDPIQRLRLLKHRLKGMSERAFHNEMISIFTRLRDLHTNYVLPEPFRHLVAFLPFRVQEFFQGSRCHYIVTLVSPLVNDPYFKPGVIVTHWNGAPISRVIEVIADREAGSNAEARHACGLEALTIRPMSMSMPPDEEWVVVNYRDGRKKRESRFEWEVFTPDAATGTLDPLSATGASAHVLGLDAKAEVERRVRKLLFAPEAIDVERTVAKKYKQASRTAKTLASDDYFSTHSIMPDVFSFHPVDTPNGTFAYIRIQTFNVEDDEGLVHEFIRIAGLLPQNGLILDVRGNGGGNILAGERLLQVLTPRKIDPERLHFINTPLTLKLCEKNDFIGQWKESIAQAVETGSTFSQGFPLLPQEKYNDIGQTYHGPVVLVTDALCYSTTDIFTAGFQDHEIGKILGTVKNTGAGGANVWDHELLSQCLPGPNSPFQALPKGASFRVAIRRTTRVGAHSGVPIEDLGIAPDEIHRVTKDDVLNGNVDLFKHAGKILASLPVYSLLVEVQKVKGGSANVTAKTRNIERLDILLNERPRESRDISSGSIRFKLTGLPRGAKLLELRGFQKGELAACKRINL